MKCNGTEDDLLQCSNATQFIITKYCYNNNAPGVICQGDFYITVVAVVK